MIRFGIIGTNFITERFLKSAFLREDFCLNAVYSRTKEKAEDFAEKYSVKNIFTDLEEMAHSDKIDAVYIASPNSFHKNQALLFMENKKHVLCEKPAASNVMELKEMIKSAEDNKVLLMEAMKTNFLPNFIEIKNNLNKIGRVTRYFGNYCQYSSRYDSYKAGKYVNTFNPEFSNGALMDLGTYCIYPLIYLFGMPESIKANGIMLPSGADGEGSIVLKYKNMEGVITYSKISASVISSEIQGENGSIVMDKINMLEDIKIFYRGGKTEDISKPQLKDSMYYEISEFLNLIKESKLQSDINTYNLSLQVMEIMDEVRKQIGLVYPADKKNSDKK
jgi:scyllo-inositol 2-dehydrogenase (NADP+)